MPYQAVIPLGLDAVMLSTAGFKAYDPSGAPAALSRPIARGLLRGPTRIPRRHDHRRAGHAHGP